MKKITLLFVSVTALFLVSCGSDHTEKFVPGSPKLVLDLTEKIISWDSIAGASKYNLYLKQVEDCADVEVAEFQTPTTADTKIADVISPFSIADYTGCTTCYYAVVAGENNIGEGALSIGVGWQIKVACP